MKSVNDSLRTIRVSEKVIKYYPFLSCVKFPLDLKAEVKDIANFKKAAFVKTEELIKAGVANEFLTDQPKGIIFENTISHKEFSIVY